MNYILKIIAAYPPYMYKLLLVLIFLISFNSFSQIRFSGEATTETMISTSEKLPFWMYHNKRGRISDNTNFAGWITGRANYELDAVRNLEVGAGVVFQDGDGKAIFTDELYFRFQGEQFYVTVGRKQQEDLYRGLSSSNRSILLSLNARPFPGLQIGTNGPFFPFGNSARGFGIEGSWNDYLLEEERYVTNARLHHKNLLFVYRTKNDLQFKAGLQHFVQWAGVSPQWGSQPSSGKDYIRIVSGQEGGADATEGDRLNALGNHLGGYEFYVKKTFRDYSVEAFYNHLFEDGSGRRLGNTPDGRYGVYFENKNRDKLINSVIYEFFYTKHQSNTTTGIHRYDHYFNHGIYRSGWTYHNRGIGAPFFTVNPEKETLHAFINNKFIAHHLGIGGRIFNWFYDYPYKLLLSYAHNDGRYNRQYNPKQDVAYVNLEYGILRSFLDLDIQLGAEYNSFTSPIYGIGMQLKKRF